MCAMLNLSRTSKPRESNSELSLTLKLSNMLIYEQNFVAKRGGDLASLYSPLADALFHLRG